MKSESSRDLTELNMHREHEFSERFVQKLGRLLREFHALDKETQEEEYHAWEEAVDKLLEEENDISQT